MKIQLLSDTHGFDFELSEEADVIVHAGDFSNSLRGAVDFARRCQVMGKDFVFALGNHDHYGTNVYSTINFLKSTFPNNALLFDNSITIKGYTFVGGTLFTNFRANRVATSDPKAFEKFKDDAESWVSDFRQVRIGDGLNGERYVDADDYIGLFKKYYNNIQKYKNKKNVVVVTHFPPHLACLDPYWGTHPTASCLNPYFINDLDVKGFTTWLSGHTHTSVDEVVDNCRLVINPLGYSDEHGKNGYKPNLLIEV